MRDNGRQAQMDTPLRTRPTLGPVAALEPRQRPAVLGSLTIPGRPAEVSAARAFVTRTMAATGKGRTVDSDAATLLTSELVTNAIQHTASGADGGTVTIVVMDVADGVLVEVIDEGSADMPVVRCDLLSTDGHGLYLVQQLTAQWGYLRDPAGTTVWFHLAADPVRLPAHSVTGAVTGARCYRRTVGRPAFLPRFSRSRMVSLTGVPAKPKSSRRRRSMNRR
jgi:anti-sigma regulatory factor (Ser/Thr protein kinase)